MRIGKQPKMSKTLPDLIETERLELRPFTLHDLAAVFDYSLSDPDWPRFQGLPSPYTLKHIEEFVSKLIEQDAVRPARAGVGGQSRGNRQFEIRK